MNTIENIKKSVRKSIENKNLKSGLKKISRINKLLKIKKNLSNDVIISLLQICSNFYQAFNLHKKQISTLKYLSNFYLDYNSMQSAYRTIDEAIEIARDNDLLSEFIELHKILLIACYYDQDLDTAIQCYDLIKDLTDNEYIGDDIEINIGVMYLNNGRVSDATKIFEKLIHKSDRQLSFTCKINLAICYRENERLSDALDILKSISHAEMSSVDDESLIEYELVYAKSLVKNKTYTDAIDKLTNAVHLIETKLESIFKLYYRRGIRERYTARLENLILSIPAEELNNKILYIIAFTRSNQISDWLNILQWSETVNNNDNVSETEKNDLKCCIQYVADNGAPFLYGMIEKYDDQHDSFNSWRWENLSSTINNISNKYNIPRPLSRDCTWELYEELLKIISDTSIIIGFLSINRTIILINDSKFEIVNISEDEFNEYIENLVGYKINTISSMEFARQIEKTQQYLFTITNEFLEESHILGKKSLIYIPDRHTDLPVTSCVLKNSALTKKMLDGSYTFKTVPVMFKRNEHPIHISKVLGVYEKDNLALSKSEIENFCKNLNVKNIELIDQYSEEQFKNGMLDADILHITTHGSPLDFYTDPAHASLGLKHVINTQNIQTKFYSLNYKLILLDSCHSASNLLRRQISLQNKNAELNKINSHDVFSLPALLLINRKSSNVSSSWKTLDKFSYILSHRISKNLNIIKNFDVCFSKAIAELTTITESSITNMLDNEIIEQKSMIDNKSHVIQMLRHPYCYATYQYYSLL